MRCIPLSRASDVASRTFTGTALSAKQMAMPLPIVPAPMTAADSTGSGLAVLGHTRNPGHLTFGEERVTQSLRLVRMLELAEKSLLELDPFVERLEHGGLDAGKCVQGRFHVAGPGCGVLRTASSTEGSFLA